MATAARPFEMSRSSFAAIPSQPLAAGTPTPAGAQVLQADGKFIIPGLWDAQLNFYSDQGEAMLNAGVTSFIGIGDNGETGVFMHEGIVKGRIVAPRPWDAPVHFQDFANLNGFESPYGQLHVLKTADEAREWTRRILALGADIVPSRTGERPTRLFERRSKRRTRPAS